MINNGKKILKETAEYFLMVIDTYASNAIKNYITALENENDSLRNQIINYRELLDNFPKA